MDCDWIYAQLNSEKSAIWKRLKCRNYIKCRSYTDGIICRKQLAWSFKLWEAEEDNYQKRLHVWNARRVGILVCRDPGAGRRTSINLKVAPYDFISSVWAYFRVLESAKTMYNNDKEDKWSSAMDSGKTTGIRASALNYSPGNYAPEARGHYPIASVFIQ